MAFQFSAAHFLTRVRYSTGNKNASRAATASRRSRTIACATHVEFDEGSETGITTGSQWLKQTQISPLPCSDVFEVSLTRVEGGVILKLTLLCPVMGISPERRDSQLPNHPFCPGSEVVDLFERGTEAYGTF